MAARKVKARTLFETRVRASVLAEVDSALGDIPGAVDRAGAAAVNKTLAKMKTRTARGLAAHLTVKQANLRRRIFVVKATKSALFGSVKIMGRPIGLINFKTLDTKRTGVRYQIKKGGPVYEEPDTFIATGKFENRHVFARLSSRRLPIATQFSQRLYDLFNDSPVPADLEAWTPGELTSQLRSQIDRFLAKPKRKR